MFFRKKKKIYINNYGHNEISLRIEYPEIEKEGNEELLFEFVKKYIKTHYFIVKLSTCYNDDLADIEEYKSMEEKFIQRGDKFDYIKNDNYRWQVLLLLTKNEEFNMDFFKEIIRLYCGGKFYINLNENDYDQFLIAHKNRKVKVGMYDQVTIYTTEDYFKITVYDADKYPNLIEDVYKLEEELHKDSLS